MKHFQKPLWIIAFPLLLNMLISQIQMIIDRAFLGQIQVEYMSALGNVSAPLWTTISVLFALTTGATILMSQALGGGKKEEAAELAHATLKYSSAAALGIFLFWFFFSRQVFSLMGVTGDVLDYCLAYIRFMIPIILITGVNAAASSILQANGYTRPILIAGVLRSVLNVVLDWLLIFGNLGFPEMGITGAAIATSIAELIGTLLLIYLVVTSRKLTFRLSFKKTLAARFSAYKRIAGKGLPSATEELLWNLGNLGIIRILNFVGPLATGIYTIVFSVDIIPALVFIAIGQGVMTLSGQKTGAGDRKGAQQVGILGLINAWIIAVVCLAVFLAVPEMILRIFTSDTGIISSSVIFLVVATINFFPRSANIVLGSGIRGFGDTKWMMKTQVFGTVFVIVLSLVFVLVLKMGILGVFLATLSDETARALINYVRFRKGPDIAGPDSIITGGRSLESEPVKA